MEELFLASLPVVMPLGQLPHFDAPAAEKLPAPQSVQYVRSAKGENVPAVHGMQLLLFLFGERVPAGHLVHCVGEVAPITDDAVPASQSMQVSFETALTVEDHEPAGHLEHTVSPTPDAHEPAGQDKQKAAPMPDTVPSRHSRHEAFDVAPGSDE